MKENNEAKKEGKQTTEDKSKQMREYRAQIVYDLEYEYCFKTIKESEELLFFNPDKGMFVANGEVELKEKLRQKAGNYYTTSLVRETTASIKADTYISFKEFNKSDINYINLKNGVLNLKTREFIERKPIDKSKLQEYDNKIKDIIKLIRETEDDYKKQKKEGPASVPLIDTLYYEIKDVRRQKEEFIVNWKREQIKKFAHFHFTTEIPVEYHPEKECPKINEFFYKSQDGNENMVKNLKGLFGYCLLRDYPIKNMFIFLGEGNSGKTTTSRLLTEFLGLDNTSSSELKLLIEDKFERKKLIGKLANISGELSSEFIKDTSLIKALTGRDLVPVRLMRSQKDEKFINFAKMIFLANKLPPTYEDERAFFNRAKIFNFPHIFVKGVDEDENILDKICTPDELSGLLNESLAELNELLKKGKFIEDESSKEMENEYRAKSNPIKTFVETMLDINMDYMENMETQKLGITKNEAYILYRDTYCKKYNIVPPSQNFFAQHINRILKEMGVNVGNLRNNFGQSYYPGVSQKSKEKSHNPDGTNFDIDFDI